MSAPVVSTRNGFAGADVDELGLRRTLAPVSPQALVAAATDVEATAVDREDRWGYGRMVRGSIFGPVVDGTAFPGADHVELYQLACSDFVYRMSSLHLAQAHAASGGVTYLYEFLWDGTPVGAAHNVEIPVLLGNLDSPYGAELYGTTPPPGALALSRSMGMAWRSFTTNGDPGWPRYDSKSQLTRMFGAEPEVARYPEQASQAIWAGYEFDPFPLRTEDPPQRNARHGR